MDLELIKSHISRCIKISAEEMDFFISLLKARSVQKKEFLLHIGEICRYDYFISKGCAKVCYADEKGTECIIKFSPEDSWVTDLDSFLNRKPSFYYIQVIEETEVLGLSPADYEVLYKTVPQFQKFSNERWQTGFIALQQRIMQSLSMTAEERYQHFKTKYGSLEQRIPQKLIAAYLGITPEFLSKLRKKWASSFS